MKQNSDFKMEIPIGTYRFFKQSCYSGVSASLMNPLPDCSSYSILAKNISTERKEKVLQTVILTTLNNIG